jgi:hypothetical protein
MHRLLADKSRIFETLGLRIRLHRSGRCKAIRPGLPSTLLRGLLLSGRLLRRLLGCPFRGLLRCQRFLGRLRLLRGLVHRLLRGLFPGALQCQLRGTLGGLLGGLADRLLSFQTGCLARCFLPRCFLLCRFEPCCFPPCRFEPCRFLPGRLLGRLVRRLAFDLFPRACSAMRSSSAVCAALTSSSLLLCSSSRACSARRRAFSRVSAREAEKSRYLAPCRLAHEYNVATSSGV